MFKRDRDLAERSRTLLKKNEVRSLRAQLDESNLSVSLSMLDGKPAVCCTRLASRTIIYSLLEPEVPIFIDVEGRQAIYPTVFTLWKFPSTLPVIRIPSPVSAFLLRGADLMAPGVTNLQGSLQSIGWLALRVFRAHSTVQGQSLQCRSRREPSSLRGGRAAPYRGRGSCKGWKRETARNRPHIR